MTSVLEVDEALADRLYWEALTVFVPAWHLAGWSFRNTAYYTVDGTRSGIYLTGAQRDSLVNAFETVKLRTAQALVS